MMRLVEGKERADALRGFLPSESEPGCQAVEHFLEHAPTVGDLWITQDGATGVLVQGREAFAMGTPDPEVGRLLDRNDYFGTLCPAISSLDTTAFLATPGRKVVTRVVFTRERPFVPPPLPPEIEIVDITPDLDEPIRSSRGAWVLTLWPAPHTAVKAQAGLVDGRLAGFGGPRTLSSGYAEIAGWGARNWVGLGYLSTASADLFDRFAELGIAVTSLVTTENEPALRYAEKVGWEPTAEETIIEVGDPRNARPGSGVPWRG